MLTVEREALLFVGDFAWPSSVVPDIRLAPDLSASCSAIPNLEGPVFMDPYRRRPRRWLQCGVWSSLPALDGLEELGVRVWVGANNHVLDYGRNALGETVAVLAQRRLALLGVGRGARSARSAAIVRLGNGRRIGILAWADSRVESVPARLGQWGANACSFEALLADVSALRSQLTDGMLVAVLHWGDELEKLPAPHQRLLSRRLVDSGADIVISHHTHVPGAIEEYRRGWIVHGLGNFLMSEVGFDGGDPKYPVASRRSLGVVLDGESIRVVNFESDPIVGRVRQTSDARQISAVWPGNVAGLRMRPGEYFEYYASQRRAAWWYPVWSGDEGRLGHAAKSAQLRFVNASRHAVTAIRRGAVRPEAAVGFGGQGEIGLPGSVKSV